MGLSPLGGASRLVRLPEEAKCNEREVSDANQEPSKAVAAVKGSKQGERGPHDQDCGTFD